MLSGEIALQMNIVHILLVAASSVVVNLMFVVIHLLFAFPLLFLFL